MTKHDKTAIQQRISEIKRHNSDSSTVQNTLAFNHIYEDGICRITENTFSKTMQFFDVSYRLAEFEEQNDIFSKYCDLINFFDNSVKFQLTFENQNRSQENLISEIEIPKQEDYFNDIRKEYSRMLVGKLGSGNNGQFTKILRSLSKPHPTRLQKASL